MKFFLLKVFLMWYFSLAIINFSTMSSFNLDRYNKEKQVAIDLFNRNAFITSLSLGRVVFNSDGLFHLINKNEKHKRDWKDQVKRFQILQYVKPVLEGMKYYQEYRENLENTAVKDHGIPRLVNKRVRYWAFVAIINDKIRIKIILKKVGDGQIIFWSVLPFWKTRRYQGIKLTDLATGDLNED